MAGVDACGGGEEFEMRESYHWVQRVEAKSMKVSRWTGTRWFVVKTSLESSERRRASVEHGHGDLGQNKPRENSYGCARTSQRRWGRGESSRWSRLTGKRMNGSGNGSTAAAIAGSLGA